MSTIKIKAGLPADLEAVAAVENRCFAAYRRSSRRALLCSLKRPTQQVWVAWAREPGQSPAVVGVLIMHRRASSLRIYSLAVLPAWRGCGVGRRLVGKVLAEARRQPHVRYVSLEADRRDRRLVRWYEGMGFVAEWRLPDYYAPGRDGVRMCYPVSRRVNVAGEGAS
jgi:[ribosomal protein S18]-alanine N-acetyltransferase